MGFREHAATALRALKKKTNGNTLEIQKKTRVEVVKLQKEGRPEKAYLFTSEKGALPKKYEKTAEKPSFREDFVDRKEFKTQNPFDTHLALMVINEKEDDKVIVGLLTSKPSHIDPNTNEVVDHTKLSDESFEPGYEFHNNTQFKSFQPGPYVTHKKATAYVNSWKNSKDPLKREAHKKLEKMNDDRYNDYWISSNKDQYNYKIKIEMT